MILLNFFIPSNGMEKLVLLIMTILIVILFFDRFKFYFKRFKKKKMEKAYLNFKDNRLFKIIDVLKSKDNLSLDQIKSALDIEIHQFNEKYRDLLLHDIANLKHIYPEINLYNYDSIISYIQKG